MQRGFLWYLVILLCSFLILSNKVFAAGLPELYLIYYPSKNHTLAQYRPILQNPAISGVQIMYTWDALEPKKNTYDFSQIEKDRAYLTSLHKKLFVQLQDRSFEPNVVHTPLYLQEASFYNGGVAKQFDFPGEGKALVTGWIPCIWNVAVRSRFQLLMQALAKQFDGKIAGISLSETAIDLDPKALPAGYTPDLYFQGILDNIHHLRAAFKHSIVIQYVNFFPDEWDNDHHRMSTLFADAIKNSYGLGGPDVVPYRKGQMKNSYPFFHCYHGKLIAVGMAVQSPDYSYHDPKTKKKYEFYDLYHFAKNYLGASILFWNIQEPFLSRSLLSHVNAQYFKVS